LEFWKILGVYLVIQNIWRALVQQDKDQNIIWTKSRGLDEKGSKNLVSFKIKDLIGISRKNRGFCVKILDLSENF
jgi:hypothetical protein